MSYLTVHHCILSIDLDNPISGEGLGFIFSSKYWESFSIISMSQIFHSFEDTSADDSFSLFVKSTPNKSFNLKHLTIGRIPRLHLFIRKSSFSREYSSPPHNSHSIICSYSSNPYSW